MSNLRPTAGVRTRRAGIKGPKAPRPLGPQATNDFSARGSVMGRYPSKHAFRHQPISGDDALAYGAAVQVGLQNSAGTARYIALSNHIHAATVPNSPNEPAQTFDSHLIYDQSVSLVKRRTGMNWVRLGPLTVTDGTLTTVGGVVRLNLPDGAFTKDDATGAVSIMLPQGLTVEELDGDPAMSNVAKIIFPNGTLTADVPNKTITFVSVPSSYYGTDIRGTRNEVSAGSTLLIPKLDHIHAALVEYGYPPTTPTDEVAPFEYKGSLGLGYDSMRGKFQVYIKKTFLGGIYGLDLKYAEMVTPLIGYGLKSTGGGARVFKTVDGGLAWNQPGYPTGSNDGGALVMLNTFAGFNANSSTGSIYKTTDGFASAPTLVYTGPNTAPSRFFFLDANNGWLVGANGYAVFTADGGSTWTVPGSPPAQLFNDVWMIDANTVIVAADHYVYLVTYSGGAWTWTDKTPTANAHYRRVKMYSATVGYIVGNNGSSYARIWKTTNGGVSWTATYTSSSTIADFRDLVIFSDTELIMCGANNAGKGVIYKSTASGGSPTTLNFDTATGVANLTLAHLLTVPGDTVKSKIWALTVPSTYASLFISYIGDQTAAWRDIGPSDIIAPSGTQPLPVTGQLWMDGSTLKVYDGSAWRSVNVT